MNIWITYTFEGGPRDGQSATVELPMTPQGDVHLPGGIYAFGEGYYALVRVLYSTAYFVWRSGHD